MKITRELLSKWNACRDGTNWFVDHFPQGGEYATVMTSLRQENLYDWVSWLSNNTFAHAIDTPAGIEALVADEVAATLEAVKDSPESASGSHSTAASSGYGSKAASCGYGSKAASCGYGSKAASSGNGSKAASSGSYSTAASCGDGSTAASSGSHSTAASCGDGSTAASSGYGSKAASVGLCCKSMAGEDGCFVLFWHDGKRDRAVVGYVGEDGIKADTLYYVNFEGKLTEA